MDLPFRKFLDPPLETATRSGNLQTENKSNEYSSTRGSPRCRCCAGVIHGDFNEKNVIVRRDPETQDVTIVGVIDFGDAERGPYIFDVAIAVTYCLLQSRLVDPVDVAGHLVAGYLSRRPGALNEAERASLWPCVAVRLAQSLTLGAYTYSVEPGNEHVLGTAKCGWPLLRRIWWETSRDELRTGLRTVLASYDQGVQKYGARLHKLYVM